MKIPALALFFVLLGSAAHAQRTVVLSPGTAAIPLVPATPAEEATPATPTTPAEGAPANPAGAKPTPPADPDTELLKKFAKATFDRRPSAILEQWVAPTEEQPEETDPENPEAPKKDENDLALEALAVQVTAGDWAAVGEFFASKFKDTKNATKGYGILLDTLARPPRAAPPKPGVPQTPQGRPNPQFSEKNLLMPGDVLALADACPVAIERNVQLPKLAALLRATLANGQYPDGLVEALEAGTAKLGGKDDPAKRDLAARLLMGAGLAKQAGVFKPEGEGAATPDGLELLVSYHLAMHAGEPSDGHLAAAWEANQALLALKDLDEEKKAAALAQAVGLAPRVEEELGAAWLGQSFTGDAERGREVLATVGAMTSRGRAEMNASAREKRLQLQQTAVDALLETPEIDLSPWGQVLNLLALNWLAEAEHSQRYDRTQSLRPETQWDRYGNMYFGNPNSSMMAQQQNGQNPRGRMPPAIAAGEILKARPDEKWLAQIDADLRPKFSAVYAKLFLKANEPEEAFPHIESVAKAQPESGHELAEEFLRTWADKRDPNSARNQNYRYGYMYGYNPRADSIPLTRSKQERNLVELAQWVTKIKALPIEAIDQDKLANAFTKVHSTAEVYSTEAIERVFGGFDVMEPDTVAAMASTMRQNLGSVWRDPKVQEANKTKRKDKEILAEVAAGYDTAFNIVERALEKNSDHWRLLLARGTIAFDWNTFAQENGDAGEFVERRSSAFAVLGKAANCYAAELPEEESDETTEAFEHWFYTALGASDLSAIKETYQTAPAQFEKIKAALEAIPEPAGERHMARFANALAARISSVKPELKQRYLKHGLSIVGDHEKAADARKVFEYYADLITEIQLVARIDGPDTVGSEEPFGLFVDIQHTKEIERESGGFSKYLTNQNNMAYGYNYGRPTQNYREKFEETLRTAFEEGFEVMSVTFHDSKVQSRGTGKPGWRVTPYGYVLMRAKAPEVDKIPPVQIDLDFLDTSGYAILPVATAALPIDARSSAGTREVADLKISQTLDEREAGEGKLGVEIKATSRGLVPALDQLLQTDTSGFELVNTDGGELTVVELDGESDTADALSERTWTLTYEAKGEAPTEFTFPQPVGEPEETTYQRYDDADMVAASSTVSLLADYGKKRLGPLEILAVTFCIAVLGVIAFILFRPKNNGPATVASRYSVPDEVTPFTVINLLRRIRDENNLPADTHSQLAERIDKLERHYFDRSAGDEPDLSAVANEWVKRAA